MPPDWPINARSSLLRCLCCFFMALTPALAAAEDAGVQLRFLSFEKGGNFGRFELVNLTGRAFELFRSQVILDRLEDGTPFKPGFDDGEYWQAGRWHKLGHTGVGYSSAYRVKAGKRLRFTMNLEDHFGNFRTGTLVRVRLEKVGGGSVVSDSFRWRELESELPTEVAELPSEIQDKLKLIPTIPEETNLYGAFKVLGLTLPDEPRESETKPGSDLVRARYDLLRRGGGYVLDCEYTLRPGDIVPGELHSLQLRVFRRMKKAGPVYETLQPTWKRRQ